LKLSRDSLLGTRTKWQEETKANTQKSKNERPNISLNEDRGVSKKEAKSRAWATVNKKSGGGKKSGSGRGKKESHSSSKKGGKVERSRRRNKDLNNGSQQQESKREKESLAQEKRIGQSEAAKVSDAGAASGETRPRIKSKTSAALRGAALSRLRQTEK
jgi:hypothetical protein